MKILKRILPHFVKKHFRARAIYKEYFADAQLFIEHSNALFKNETLNKLRADIIMRYHAIEKGLTMPERRFSFGEDLILTLIDECNQFASKFNNYDYQVIQAVKILKEYLDLHDVNSVELNSQVVEGIRALEKLFGISTGTVQIKSDLIEFSNSRFLNFDAFARSRFSARNYSDKKIPLSIIESAVELAQTAPSACNRQPSKVVVLEDKGMIKKVLSYQNGNRGFGHLADKLLLVIVDLSGYNGRNERNLPWVDGGMFSMNLLYGLHFNGIAACPLNWCVETSKSLKVNAICGIPKNYRIILAISCGYAKVDSYHPISLRYNTEDVIITS